MNLKTILAALGASVALTVTCSGPLAEGQTTTARADAAERPSMTMGEFNRWKRNWDRRLREMYEADPEHYAWGKEKRPIKAYAVVLDPPLERVGDTDKVTVEWFFSPMDERTGTSAWQLGMFAMFRWRDSIKEAGEDRIEILPRSVSTGPGVPPRFEGPLRLIQDMLYAWDESPWRGDANKVYTEIIRKNNFANMTEGDARDLIEKAGLDLREWDAKRSSPETRERATRVDARYEEAMRQAAAQNDRYLVTPQDPVLLIDGKYLLTGYVTGRTKTLFRMANRIIRERLDEMPEHTLDEATIAWGNEHRPKRKELVVLPGEERTGSGIEIEWFFTYLDEEGQATNVEWFDKTLEKWREGVQVGGVRNIRIVRTPVVRMTPGGDTRWDAHRRAHQELMLGWSDERPGWRRQVHAMLPKFLARDPRGIGSLEAGAAVLEGSKLPVEQHRADLATPERQDAIARANERVLAIRSELPRRLQDTVVDPVLVVNGKYLVEGQTAGSIERVFQILNWVVREISERAR